MNIGILAVQGAFIEHAKMLEKLNVSSFEIRKKDDLNRDFDGLILPGGESTTHGKLIRELGMYDILKSRIESGLPTLATCAGLILLAENIANDSVSHLATLPVTVKRNAYGRQLGSFFTTSSFGTHENVPMTFIRAPYVETASPNVEIMSVVDDKIVGVKYKNQIGVAFHPELNDDTTIHQMFIDLC